MFQRPPQRRTINSVNSGSAYVNYNPPGMDVGYGQAPPAYDNGHQQHHREPPVNRKQKSRGGVPCGFFLIWTILCLAGPYIYFEYFSLPERVADDTKDEVEHVKHHWMTKYHSLQLQHEALEKSHTTLKQRYESVTKNSAGNGNSADLERQLQERNRQLDEERVLSNDWKNRAVGFEESQQQLHRTIQENSRKQLIKKYGDRTIKVELEVSFGGDDKEWIVIEMAPIHEMPHTVLTFLEQVSQGLFNEGGYSFHHNGPHILMGSPVPNHLTPEGVDNHEKFHSHGIANILFQEYSENYPHQAYTLGFAGRPGGPSFYINTRDNSQIHGPGGYSQDGKADPCFARIAEGQEIVDRIHGLTGELVEGDWKEIQPYVAVWWAKIL